MTNKTIAKIPWLVIFVIAVQVISAACSHASSNVRYSINASEVSPAYGAPTTVGKIESNDITESSGLAASPCQPDVFWTHNDSGDDAFIFAFNGKGKHLGTWKVSNARNADWEDMAAFKDDTGQCFLYIGDIGNNKRERDEQRVYRIKEPQASDSSSTSTQKDPLETDASMVTVFKYPETPFDAETMIVQPQTGDVYVLTKRIDGPALVFKIKPDFASGTPVRAEKVGEVSLPAVPNGLLTGGTVSPDGKRVVVCDYSAGYELTNTSVNFDDIWKQKPVQINVGDRRQGEAVTFSADGRSIFTTSEMKNSPIIEVKLK